MAARGDFVAQRRHDIGGVDDSAGAFDDHPVEACRWAPLQPMALGQPRQPVGVEHGAASRLRRIGDNGIAADPVARALEAVEDVAEFDRSAVDGDLIAQG